MISKIKLVLILIFGICCFCNGSGDLFADDLKPIHVRGDHDYPPYEYLNDAGQPDGFNVDIVRAVAKEMGMEIRIELGPWEKVRSQLEAGKIDALIGMFSTKKRDERVDFSIPHFIASYAVFIRDGSDIRSLEDAYQKAILVQRADLAHDFAVENQITDKLVVEETAESVLMSLSEGRADCAIISRLQALIILKKKNIKNVKPVGAPIIQRKYCIAVTEGNSTLLAKLNEGLNIIKTTGDYNVIYEKWFGVYERGDSKYQTIFRSFFLITAPLILIIIIVFIWNFLLKREVTNRTLALSETEERYRLLVEKMNEGLAIQKNQCLTYVNNSFCKMLGYEKEELIGKNLKVLYKSEHRKLLKEQMVLRKKGRTESYETEMLTRDGQVVYVKISPHLMSFQGDLLDGSSAIFTDLSKRKLAEDELRRSRDQFQSLVDNLPGIIYRCRCDKDWTMLFMSSNVVKLTGYPAEDFINNATRTFENIIHYDDAGYVKKKIDEAVASGVQWELEYRILHKHGRVRWVYERGSCVVGSDAENKFLDGFILDITSRKEAENELKKARIYISNIIDSMPSILIGVDHEGIVTHWNFQAEQVSGIASGQAVGSLLETVTAGLSIDVTEVFESMQAQKLYSYRKKVFKEKNETVYQDITIYPLINDGLTGAVIRLDDVTGKVRMEEVLIQNEKMLSVGGLAAGMAHEINNPLAAIMHTADVMKNRLSENHIPANIRAAEEHDIHLKNMKAYMEDRGIIRMLTTIGESGRRVADIVNNMLSFARKSDTKKALHDLNDLLDRTLTLAVTDYDIKNRYDFKSIGIEKDYSSDIPAVPCEDAKIQQVLLNIFRNGAQAMREAGSKQARFIIRTRLGKDKNQAVIEIEDNGPGIDKDIRKRIFEPFFTTKPAGMGTGLGLSVSYFIINENHHGELTVESVLGQGAKFIISLPLEKMNRDVD